MDIVGPFDNSKERFAICLIDYFSKWPEVRLCSNVCSENIIDFLDEIFSREGLPKEIVTDNGVQFVSHEFENYLKSKGIRHLKSAIYNPKSNGSVERFNKNIKTILQIANIERRPLKNILREFLMNDRCTKLGTTNTSPSDLLHKRGMRSLIGTNVSSESTSIKSYVEHKQSTMKNYYDHRNRV